MKHLTVSGILGRGRKCALSALMLLAILAPCAQAALKYDVGGYVQDGLVLHLDGIRNAGAQAAHDSGALQWADLAAKGGAARIVKETDGGEWTADGYCFDGSVHAKVNYAVMNGTRTLDAAFTAQAVVDFDCNASHRLNTAWPGIIGTTDLGDAFALYYNQNNTGAPGVNNKVLNVSSGFGISPWGGKYISTLFTGSQIAVFETSTPSTYKAFEKSPGTNPLSFNGFEAIKPAATDFSSSL